MCAELVEGDESARMSDTKFVIDVEMMCLEEWNLRKRLKIRRHRNNKLESHKIILEVILLVFLN